MKKIAHPRMKTLVAATALGLALNAQALTLTVTSSADLGAGTLRNALATIAADTGCTGAPYVVNFNIAAPPTGPIVLGVGSAATGQPYPTANCTTTIDGYSQPGTSPNSNAALGASNAVIRIFIDGTLVSAPPQNGITVGGNGSIVQGIAVGNFAGIGIAMNSSSGKVKGNFVGLGPDGLTPAPNNVGVASSGFSVAAEVGGISASDRNVIGTNATGIALNFDWKAWNNLIGTAADGVTARGNNIGLSAGTNSAVVGGFAAGEPNRIAFNQKGAVTVNFPNSGYNFINNEIFSNALLGIDLNNDGPTANDPGDSDPGTQNSPRVANVTYSGGITFLTADFDPAALTSPNLTGLAIQFFGNDPTGPYQGKIPMNCALNGLTTDATGQLTGGSVVTGCTGIFRNITATATSTGFSGGTSEFSPPFLTPDMSPSTPSLNFGTVAVGQSSAVLPMTIQNSGQGPLFVDSVVRSLADYGDTTGGPPPNANHWCGLGSSATGAPLPGPSAVSIAPGANCTLNLVFSPQNSGARNATLTINDANSPVQSVVVNLLGSGNVTPPPVTWTFLPVSVALNAPSQLRLSIANPNGAPFSNPNFTYNLPANLLVAAVPNAANPVGPCSGAFVPPPTGGAASFTVQGLQVPTGGSCDFTVDVASAIAGLYNVNMAAGAIVGSVLSAPVSNAASNTATLTVAAPASPAVSLSSAALNFGNVTVATTSPPQTVTLTNTGTAPLILGALTFTGDFAPTSTCPIGPPGLAPTNACTIDVTFTPTIAAVRTGNITIPSNATPPTNTISLTGTGVAAAVPIASLSASVLSFPTQTVGTTSSPQVVTLTNTGAAPLLITQILSSGDFGQSNNCPASLPAAPGPGNACQITITFTPIIAGTRVGDVKVFDNASGSPHIVTLNGLATAPPVPTVSAPSVVNFPPTQVGSVSAAVSVTVSNSGVGNLVISAAQVVGSGYALASDNCTGASIPSAGSCTMTLTFAPGATGSIIATLRLISNAPASPTFIGLTGTGTAGAVGTLSAAPATLDFGSQVIGVTSAAQPVVITNAGSATVTVSGVTTTGDYAQANDCAAIAAGGNCTVSVTFTPALTGPRPGSVSIASDASNSPLSVNLTGSGTPVPGPVIELSVSSLSFGNRVMGTGSASQPVTLRNVGGASLLIERIYPVGDFVVANGCPSQVDPGQSCRLDVGFAASVPGARTGKMVILSNAQGGTKEAQLSGTGCRLFSLTGSRTTTLLCQ